MYMTPLTPKLVIFKEKVIYPEYDFNCNRYILLRLWIKVFV